MPAPRHPLEGHVKELIANKPDWGADRIRQLLEKAAADAGIEQEDLPSVATIGRIKRKMSGPERAPYLYVRWPETFAAGFLPWEAAASIFELLQHRTKPVTTGEAQWYWRVTLARPDVSVPDRWRAAWASALYDHFGGADEWRTIESFLAGRVGISEVLALRAPKALTDALMDGVRAFLADWAARYPGRTLGEVVDLEEQNDSQG
jgi:hypothetical protein